MRANYHTHTHRCRHAGGTEREYIETAIERGLTLLGFSDHTPQLFPGEYYSNFRMRPEQFEDYITTLRNLREEYKNDIEIKIGLETEYYPDIFGNLLDFIQPYNIDYMILGQHFIFNEYDNHTYSGTKWDDEALLCQYVDQTLEALGTGKFTYFAHPDLFLFTGSDEVYEKHYRRLCEGAKALGIPLEINFLGLADNRHYPSERFFSLAAEVGCDFIFGCDAHQVDAVANPNDYKKACAFAEKFGIVPLEQLELRKI